MSFTEEQLEVIREYEEKYRLSLNLLRELEQLYEVYGG